MATSSIGEQLASLSKLQKPNLCRRWQQLFKTNPPTHLRKELMVQFIAYCMQEQERGALSAASRWRLIELARVMEAESNTYSSRKRMIKSGTRLIRQWKDQVHVVNVEEGNYEYRGARYDSLSEIARLITGTRWSGPLFFGLKDKSTTNAKETA